ncbi:hypothetical protein ACTFIW_010133 [Dictyostelium discoideum]
MGEIIEIEKENSNTVINKNDLISLDVSNESGTDFKEIKEEQLSVTLFFSNQYSKGYEIINNSNDFDYDKIILQNEKEDEFNKLLYSINLPYKITNKQFKKFNKTNENRNSFVNDTLIGVPSSTFIDFSNLLPFFSSNQKSIKKIISINKDLHITTLNKTILYIRLISFNINIQISDLYNQLNNSLISISNLKGKFILNSNLFYLLPSGIRKPDIIFYETETENDNDNDIDNDNENNDKIKFKKLIPNHFILECRSKGDSLNYCKRKVFDWINFGVKTALLVDGIGSNSSRGGCYYYCLSPESDDQLPLIPNSTIELDSNNEPTGLNVLYYDWNNYNIQPNMCPNFRINLVDHLSGIVIDFSKIQN